MYTEQKLRMSSKYTDEVLDVMRHSNRYTQSDLQSVIQSILLKAINVGAEMRREQEYFETFEVVDGLNQQPEGLSLKEWEKKYEKA